jgi:23S rRNA (uridine2552-2'-O)-methyltransferase
MKGKKMTKKWLRANKREYYHRLAKEEGYRSRAAYKLLQTSKKHRLIKKGYVVVDLGAAPGGWMQVARKLVGADGYVLGVDKALIEDFEWENVASLVSDISVLDGQNLLKELPRKADVVLSDVSPNISGIWDLDHARQIGLAESSLKIATLVLRIDGAFFVKVFHGALLKDFMEKIKKYFMVVRFVKPKASKKRSSEMYVLALGFKGNEFRPLLV